MLRPRLARFTSSAWIPKQLLTYLDLDAALLSEFVLVREAVHRTQIHVF